MVENSNIIDLGDGARRYIGSKDSFRGGPRIENYYINIIVSIYMRLTSHPAKGDSGEGPEHFV